MVNFDRNLIYSSGFTYLGLLIFVAVLGLATAASITLGSVIDRRNNEDELIFIGNQFRLAFQSYYNLSPNADRYPRKLDDLVEDSRFPHPVRHLRKIYVDPMTRSTDWQTFHAPEGGIMGISSRSNQQPVKTGNFGQEEKHLENKGSYSAWVFYYNPEQIIWRPSKPALSSPQSERAGY